MSTQTEAPPLENNITLKKLKLKKKKTTKQTKKAAEIYTKMEHAEHILKKPDTYLGSAEPENIKTFLHDNEGNKMIEKEIDLTPGFYKCFDELLVNAHAHKKRMQKVANDGNQHYMVNNIKVNINDDNSITFYNDGDGILVEYMEEHKMYPPTLIFGALLSGTNFDDNEAREWGGRNGYGAKLANIFSMKFIVETVCHVNKKKFYQEFTNNMQDKTEPVITSAKIKPYTKITWYPDFKRFNMTGLNDDIKALMCKRVYDIAGVTDKDTKIYLNDSLIHVKTFEKYVDMYIGDKSETSRVFEEGVGWQVVATCSDDDIFQQVSFVNGIKPQIIKNQLKIFVNASKIVNPVFDSQTKETLKTPKAKFGTTFDISDKFITQLVKTDIFAKIQAQAAYKDSQLLSKTDGKKSKRVRVNKLSDANKAGTPDSKKCTIIFTDGDSAKTRAISVNTDYIKQYEKTGVWPLRYGQIMIMTDQDHDGSHIKGLMMNIFDSMWPELTKMGFITSMVTPIVKAFKGKNEKVFYTLQDYEKWRDSTNAKSWRIKYYKGLGTSSTKEAKEYFKQLKVIKYLPTEVDSESVEDESKSSEESKEDDDKTSIKSTTSEKKTSTTYKSICPDLDLAFNKKRANDRKAWLLNYEKNKIPDFNKKVISTKDFVDEELIHFSNEDNDRSIPSLIDGFKPSQRKVAFGSFKRKLKTDVKVAQLAGYISEHAAYHHGEVSLENTIKNMAQDYVSANNINYLEPIGQFGSRLMGGDDAAQSRYIFTKLSPITRLVFKEEDDCLCNYLDDDGFSIEPEFYFPIFPTILANGASGIGTGFSTDIPKFNPIDICNYIKAKIHGKETPTLIPWYRGFTGTIESTSPGSFITRGKFNIINDSTVQITELPIGTWTEKYTEFLDKISVERGKETAKNFVRTFKDDSTETQVNITIKMNPLNINKWGNKFGKDGISELENRLKLTSALGITNMHMFNENGKMQKFKDIDEIIDQWFPFRAGIYTKRRDYMLKKLQKELDIIKYKVAFIQEIIDDTIEIKNVKKQKIMDQLTEHKFPKISIKEDQEPSFDYLMSMDLYKLTEEEIDELKKKKEMKQLEFDELSGTSSTDLWVNDIDKFVESYKKSLIQYNRDHSAPVLSNKKKLKKPRKKKT